MAGNQDFPKPNFTVAAQLVEGLRIEVAKLNKDDILANLRGLRQVRNTHGQEMNAHRQEMTLCNQDFPQRNFMVAAQLLEGLRIEVAKLNNDEILANLGGLRGFLNTHGQEMNAHGQEMTLLLEAMNNTHGAMESMTGLRDSVARLVTAVNGLATTGNDLGQRLDYLVYSARGDGYNAVKRAKFNGGQASACIEFGSIP